MAEEVIKKHKYSYNNFKLSAVGQYDGEGIFYSEEEAWNKFSGFISNQKLEEIKSIKDVETKEIIFKSLFSLQKRIAQGETSSNKLEERVDKAIERAQRKAVETKRDRVGFIVTTDALYATRNENELTYKIRPDFSNFVHLTKDNIIIIGKNTYDTYKTDVYTRHADEVRVITHDIHEKPKFDNVVFYDDPLKALSHKRGDYRSIFICGGQQIFELYFTRMTDLYISTLDIIFDNPTAWFPEFNPWDFDVRESVQFPAKGAIPPITISHLRVIKGHKLKLKPSKYSNGLMMDEKLRFLLQ